jgi:hypothetical protein
MIEILGLVRMDSAQPRPFSRTSLQKAGARKLDLHQPVGARLRVA